MFKHPRLVACPQERPSRQLVGCADRGTPALLEVEESGAGDTGWKHGLK